MRPDQWNALTPKLGVAKCCRKVFSEMHRVDEHHPWTAALREVMEPRADGTWDVVINDEIPPDRMVFVDSDGELVATVMLEPQG